MKFQIDDDYKVNIFGKEFNSLQHIGILFGYVLFLMFFWPLLSGSYLFVPLVVVILPIILPEFIYNEIYSNVRLYNALLYLGVSITTFVYTYFVLECSFFVSLLHFVMYSFFCYLYSKKKG